MIAAGVLWMKDDFGTAHRRPADGFGIAPGLMANRYAGLHAVDFK